MECGRKYDKPGKQIPYRGLLDKRIPPPATEGVEVGSGEWKPIVEKSGKPTFILFWTKWYILDGKFRVTKLSLWTETLFFFLLFLLRRSS